MSPLVDHLVRFDYAVVPLLRAATGHLFLAQAAINGRAITLYLDTGAGRTVLDVGAARSLGLTLAEDERGAGGAGAAKMKSYRTQLAWLDFGGGALVEENFSVAATDLSHVNQALLARGERPMDGVLGADLLDAREAIIEYRHQRLFLKRSGCPRAVA